jgi:hypothetical protein
MRIGREVVKDEITIEEKIVEIKIKEKIARIG